MIYVFKGSSGRRSCGLLSCSVLLAVVFVCLPGRAQTAPPPVVPAGQPATTRPAGAGGGRFVVVLDAAHGGDDGGAQLAGAVAEKTVTLALSVRLRSLLTARGFQVVTTREGNVTLDSNARAQIANRAGLAGGAGAGACLSLHATQSGAGVHIFVSSLAQTAGPQGRFVAWKTAQSGYVLRSLKLASAVNSALERGTDAGPIAANLNRTNLPGVDSMACPAVALEVAPIRGDDGKVVTEVTDPDYQTQIVEALAAAVLAWRTEWESERSDSSAGMRPDLKAAGARLP